MGIVLSLEILIPSDSHLQQRFCVFMCQVVTHISAFVPLTLKAENTKSTNFSLIQISFTSVFIYVNLRKKILRQRKT